MMNTEEKSKLELELKNLKEQKSYQVCEKLNLSHQDSATQKSVQDAIDYLDVQINEIEKQLMV